MHYPEHFEKYPPPLLPTKPSPTVLPLLPLPLRGLALLLARASRLGLVAAEVVDRLVQHLETVRRVCARRTLARLRVVIVIKPLRLIVAPVVALALGQEATECQPVDPDRQANEGRVTDRWAGELLGLDMCVST